MAKGYSEEYKKEALKLVGEIGAREASNKLGVTEWSQNQWKKGAGLKKKAEKTDENNKLVAENRELQEKIREMEKEMTRVKKENEFLEDAARFFAQHRQKSNQS